MTRAEVLDAMTDLAEARPGQKFFSLNHKIWVWLKDGVLHITDEEDGAVVGAEEAVTK